MESLASTVAHAVCGEIVFSGFSADWTAIPCTDLEFIDNAEALSLQCGDTTLFVDHCLVPLIHLSSEGGYMIDQWTTTPGGRGGEGERGRGGEGEGRRGGEVERWRGGEVEKWTH